MGVHALTLPIILNILYIILNAFTGYTIKYFQIMYTAISYIYMVAAILIIKSDYIKRQMELDKLKSEQEKVRAELDRQKRRRQKRRRKKKRRKERSKKKKSLVKMQVSKRILILVRSQKEAMFNKRNREEQIS